MTHRSIDWQAMLSMRGHPPSHPPFPNTFFHHNSISFTCRRCLRAKHEDPSLGWDTGRATEDPGSTAISLWDKARERTVIRKQ